MNAKGFTLLELLLSLTIMAIIVALSFGAFQTGVRAWEKGEKKIIENQQIRIVPMLIRRQVASLSLPAVFKRDGDLFYFLGEERFLEFFSRISLLPENSAEMVYVRYVVREDGEQRQHMSFYERSLFALNPMELDDLPDDDFQSLLEDQRSVTFAYLSDKRDDDGNLQWLTSWNARELQSLPRAVRITLQKDESDHPVVLFIPLNIDYPG